MLNKSFAKIFASTIAPDPEMNVLWMDLSASSTGSIIKYWTGTSYALIKSDSIAEVPEAPIDGKQYVREDGAWAEVNIPDSTTVYQTQGGSTTGVMSQNATTYALQLKQNKITEFYSIGQPSDIIALNTANSFGIKILSNGDFGGASLDETVINDFTLTSFNFSEAALSCDIHNNEFINCSFENAVFLGAAMNGNSFSNCTFNGASFLGMVSSEGDINVFLSGSADVVGATVTWTDGVLYTRSATDWDAPVVGNPPYSDFFSSISFNMEGSSSTVNIVTKDAAFANNMADQLVFNFHASNNGELDSPAASGAFSTNFSSNGTTTIWIIQIPTGALETSRETYILHMPIIPGISEPFSYEIPFTQNIGVNCMSVTNNSYVPA